MPRKRRPAAGVPDDAASRTDRARIWFASADASAHTVGDWDIKGDLTIQALLAVLQSGCAIMFGTTRDGGSVSLTIYDGDDKHRVYCSDSIEWDDAMDSILATARPQRHIRAVGD